MDNSFKSMLQAYKEDLPAGLVVFLVALPLCLGIALASGAPLFSGLIAGIIGGIVVGSLSGSHTSVSGPAAGLAVIVLTAIEELGAFDLFLTAVLIAGVLQLILGYLKAGIIGLYFPNSVIRGMLAAIGLILILKQIPYFFGVADGAFGAMQYQKADGAPLSFFLHTIQQLHPGALLIGSLSLTTMLLWDKLLNHHNLFRILPGALAGVVLGVLLNSLFHLLLPNLVVGKAQLVNIPSLADAQTDASLFILPDLDGLWNPVVWRIAMVIALVASLETLLSIEAVDKLDPHKRHTPNNRELKAQGVGNMLCGAIGGLPLTAVIVRSSANVDAGNRTKMSAIYHGIMLLVCVIAIPWVLNMIPLSSLAAVLLIVGYKLSKPRLYREFYFLGWNQFLPFIITILAILFTDLLSGIIIGMIVGVFFILRINYKTPYYYQDEASAKNGQKQITIALSEHVSFLNKASLQLTLDHIPDNSHVVIDGSRCREIDYDALNIIKDFTVSAKERNIHLQIKRVPFEYDDEKIMDNREHNS